MDICVLLCRAGRVDREKKTEARGVTQEDFFLFLSHLQTPKRYSQGSVNEASAKDLECFLDKAGELAQN